MKCEIPHCPTEESPELKSIRRLCDVHQDRYWADHHKSKAAKMLSGPYSSWYATWVQMVDLEMQNEIKAPPPPPKSSYFIAQKIVLPPEAFRAGKQKLKTEAKEQDLLEAQLALDVAEYARGRRMELEHELREKRRVEK